MNFLQFVASGQHAIAEGAVLERVRRTPGLTLDPHILNAGFVYDPLGRAAQAEIHRGYMRTARDVGMPLFALTDTWRCSKRAIDASLFAGRPVNEDNVRFLKAVRAEFGGGPPIFVGGLVGPSGDAYKPEEGLGRDAARGFHRPQVEALVSAGVDYLHLATAPNVEEALGVADLMAATGVPYVVSFVIRRTGTVLDGTPLGEAIARLDAQASRPPAGFSVNCVHANALASALETVQSTHPAAVARILTFQANTADAEPEKLDESADLVTEASDLFATNVHRLGRRFGLRVLGGCCGTDGGHIEALARKLACQGADRKIGWQA